MKTTIFGFVVIALERTGKITNRNAINFFGINSMELSLLKDDMS